MSYTYNGRNAPEATRNVAGVTAAPTGWPVVGGGLGGLPSRRSGVGGPDFITTWETTTASESITVPTTGVGYDCTVDWGDGSPPDSYSGTAPVISHVYATAGTYTVRISGAFPRIFFSNTGDRLKIRTVENWGDLVWSSGFASFYGCANLTSMDAGAANTGNVLTLEMFAFNAAALAVLDVSRWDVSNITNYTQAFRACASLTSLDVADWDVSKAVTFNNLVSFCTSLTHIDVSRWDTRSVTSFFNAFRSTSSLTALDVSGWDTSQVTSFGDFLRGPTSVTVLDAGGWDVANCISFTSFLFSSALTTASYSSILIGWATRPTWSITAFAASGDNTVVTAAGHNIKVNNRVTITGTTNYNNTAATPYTVSAVTADTFTINTAFVANDATGTVRKDLRRDLNFHGGGSKYSAGAAADARAFLISEYNWTFTDGGLA